MTQTSPAQVAFSSGEISPLLRTRFDYQRFQTGLAACRGFIPLMQGGVTRAPGTLHRGQTRADDKARLIPFEFAANDTLILEFTPLRMRVWRYGQLVGGGAPYELVTPYGADSLDRLQWVQSADVIYLADGINPVQRLARFALNNWTIGAAPFKAGPFRVQNLTKGQHIRASAETGSITLTASWNFFAANHVGSLLQLKTDNYADIPLWTGQTSVSNGDLMRYDGRIYEVVGQPPTELPIPWPGGGTVTVPWSGNTGVNPPIHSEGIEQTSKDPDIRWRYLSDGEGVVRITSITSPTTAQATVVRALPRSVVTRPTYRWAEGAWSTRHGYPAILELHEERLVAASTPTDPRTLWFSAVGDYMDFEPGADADSSFAYSVAGGSSVNRVIWLKSGRDGLHIGALGEEYSSIQPNRSEPLSAVNIAFRFGSSYGSREHVRPIAPDGLPMFISKDGARLIEISFSFEKDSNIAGVLSRPADHIGAEGFAEVAWMNTPQRQAWLRTDAGSLVVMTYDPSEEILGWAWCPIADGIVESLAVTRNAEGTRDVLTMVVRRTIGAALHRYIEEQAITFGSLPGLPAIQDAVHLCCARQFSLSMPQSAFAVAHLANCEVIAWTDQGQFGPLIVPPGGTLTLPVPVSKAVIGLLDETHHIRTLPLIPQTPNGSGLHRRKRLSPPIGIGLHQSAAAKVAVIESDFGQAERAWPAQNVVPRAVAAVLTQAYTGVAPAPLTSGYADELAIEVRAVGAAPLTITALVPTISEAGI